MKNPVIIIAATLLLSGTAALYAQEGGPEDTRDKLHIGIKGGLSYATLIKENDPSFDVDPKLGYVGGAYLSIPIGTYLGIQPEVLVSQKGFSADGRNALGTSYTFERTTTYLDIPILVQFKPVEPLTIVLGPQYSYIMSKRDQVSGPDATVVDNVSYENDNITKNIFGAVVGLDVNIGHFMIFGRYNIDLRTNNGDGTSSVPQYKNQVIQAGVGLRL